MTVLSTLLNSAGGVRDIIQDVAKVRFSDNQLVQWANDALQTLALARPDLFSTIGDIVCTAGATIQAAPAGAIRIMDIFQVKTGRVVREALRASFDGFNTDWHNATAGPAENWMRHDKDPLKFFIYPKAPNPQTLVGQWSAAPTTIALGDNITLVGYDTAIKDYVIFRSESVQDEQANAARAATHLELFKSVLGVTVDVKALTDKPEK